MIDVVMPQMGESIVEGTLTKWLKKPGDHVERDEPLFEISTDKVDTEIPSPAAGTLAEIVIEEGKTVGINTVVGRINEGDGAGAAGSAAAPAPAPPQPSPQADGAEPSRPEPAAAAPQAPPPAPPAPAATVVEETAGPLSPLVRKMAREHNVDLSRVKGTGAGGRITKQDLEAYLASRPGPAAGAPPSAAMTTVPPRPTPPREVAPQAREVQPPPSTRCLMTCTTLYGLQVIKHL